MPPIVIDTREQLPYEFHGSVRGALPTGDYSIYGYEDRVAVERKSKPDAYGSLSVGRKRFEKEFARLAELEYAAVVVESTMDGFLDPPAHSQLRPRAALNSLIGWGVKFRVPVLFAGDRRMARALVLRTLMFWWRYLHESEQ